ncbi:MAG: phenylalanine--tRNA ligase subunit beta [Pyrinomonadaceae bacterium]
MADRTPHRHRTAINNVADVTNYVMHELGQPLHAFDYERLEKGRIIVRRARAGERIRTLDGVERALDAQMLVIADARRSVAVAGIMGGEETEISPATRDVLVESAYFNPASVRRTSRELGLRTEASHRFERGVDYDNTLCALDRCVALITELAGGGAEAEVVDVYPAPLASPCVGLRFGRVERLTGLEHVSVDEMSRIMSALGFSPSAQPQGTSSAAGVHYVVPTWRFDIEREEDLIEEVARHVGYDKIAATLPGARVAGEYQAGEWRRRAARLALGSQGFDEAINFSFIDGTYDHLFELIPVFGAAENDNLIGLGNPISEGLTRMRPSLLPGLLEAVRRNFDHNLRDVTLYELGRVFAAGNPKPTEREALALVATGGFLPANRAGAPRELDFFDLKGGLEAAVEAMRVPALRCDAARVAHLREGQSARITMGDVVIGSIGRLSESLAARYKFRQPIYVGEIDLSALDEYQEKPVRYRPLGRYPAVLRDMSLVVDKSLAVSEIMGALERIEVDYKRGVSFVDVFEGGSLPAGKRSVTVRIEYRADDRTLLIDEVDVFQTRVMDELGAKVGAELRQ